MGRRAPENGARRHDQGHAPQQSSRSRTETISPHGLTSLAQGFGRSVSRSRWQDNHRQRDHRGRRGVRDLRLDSQRASSDPEDCMLLRQPLLGLAIVRSAHPTRGFAGSACQSNGPVKGVVWNVSRAARGQVEDRERIAIEGDRSPVRRPNVGSEAACCRRRVDRCRRRS